MFSVLTNTPSQRRPEATTSSTVINTPASDEGTTLVRRPADAGFDAETSRNIVREGLSTLVNARDNGEIGRNDEQDERGDEQRDDLAPASTDFGARVYRLAVRFRLHPIGSRAPSAYIYFLGFSPPAPTGVFSESRIYSVVNGRFLAVRRATSYKLCVQHVRVQIPRRQSRIDEGNIPATIPNECHNESFTERTPPSAHSPPASPSHLPARTEPAPSISDPRRSRRLTT